MKYNYVTQQNYSLNYRKFLQYVIQETLAEIQSNKSFDALVRAVGSEKEKKAGLQQTILKYVKLIEKP